MNQLITASIGLYVDGNNYYLQVIGADTDGNWLLPISYDNALSISITENLEIALMPK